MANFKKRLTTIQTISRPAHFSEHRPDVGPLELWDDDDYDGTGLAPVRPRVPEISAPKAGILLTLKRVTLQLMPVSSCRVGLLARAALHSCHWLSGIG